VVYDIDALLDSPDFLLEIEFPETEARINGVWGPNPAYEQLAPEEKVLDAIAEFYRMGAGNGFQNLLDNVYYDLVYRVTNSLAQLPPTRMLGAFRELRAVMERHQFPADASLCEDHHGSLSPAKQEAFEKQVSKLDSRYFDPEKPTMIWDHLDYVPVTIEYVKANIEVFRRRKPQD